MIKRLLIMVVLVSLLFGCSSKTKDTINDNYRVFYQIFVGSFSDSNNDGIGDLRGIINRFDYLNDGNANSKKSLGVQGLWLSPIFISNSYHKYDVIDYYQIDPQFGTMDDLKELIELCHQRNVKIILDIPFNHTSSQHDWFRNFVAMHQSNNTSNIYYDFYTYVTKENKVNGRVYNAIPTTNHFYECNFSNDMPELNFDNKLVREEILKIAEYYLELGVDGFRFDAAKYIYYRDNPSSIEFWNWYMDKIKEIKPDIYVVGEVWSNDIETLQYIKELNCFNFHTSQTEGSIAVAAKGGNCNIFTTYVDNYLDKIKQANPDAMYIPFISNHDMDRSAGYLMMANKFSHMAANLYILCSGSPFIYYGEEIGMKGTRGAANTDANRRLAMLWGDNDTVKDPVGTTYDSSKQTNGTVASHLKDKDSLFHHYRKLIDLRNKYPQIARGEYDKINFIDTFVGGFIITYEGETTYLMHNTGQQEKTIDLSLYPSLSISKVCDYIGQSDAKLEGNNLKIGPQTSVILK